MNIEEEIFKRSKVDFEKLLSYGFQKKEVEYVYSKKIMDETFRVDVIFSKEGMIAGKVYDLSFDEEYTNYRFDQMSGFASRVKEEFEAILRNIKESCTQSEPFISAQACQITRLIYEKYHTVPEFIWEKYPGYGIFRNIQNQKWYGLIMNIQRSKVDKGEGEIEILNVKLPEEKVVELLKKNGFYPAYHMNKKNWISILLDKTLNNKEIMEYIEESYRLTSQKSEWLLPANPKYYDVIHCFDDTDTLLWKQSSHIEVGDIVHIYVAAPYSAILYRCEVREVDIPYTYKDKNLNMQKVMKIKLLKRYDEEEFPFTKLNEYGVRAIRGPRRVSEELSKKLI